MLVDSVRSVRRQADEESEAAIAADRGGVDRATIVILLVAALSLTLGQFLSRDGTWLVHLLRDAGARVWPGVSTTH